MNMLEQYIVEVHSEKPYIADWTKEFDYKFVEVDVTTNCYGSKQRSTQVFSEHDWDINKERGFYWG